VRTPLTKKGTRALQNASQSFFHPAFVVDVHLADPIPFAVTKIPSSRNTVSKFVAMVSERPFPKSALSFFQNYSLFRYPPGLWK
jgi:hypothetical protein